MRKSHTNPGYTESPNQEELKEAHSKTHQNYNGKIPRQRENLKGSKGKQKVTYRGAPIRLAADLSVEMLQARREWQGMFQVMKNKGLQLRLFNQ